MDFILSNKNNKPTPEIASNHDSGEIFEDN